MSDRPRHLLFLCTHNSARSVLAEAIASRIDPARFRGFSAGSFPSGRVNPLALELLERLGHPVKDLRSKSWDEFAAPGAPPIDFVFTVCDNAAGETCPIWPGRPAKAHWGLPDPSAVPGSDDDRRRAFLETYRALERRLRQFAALPLDRLQGAELAARLAEIGRP